MNYLFYTLKTHDCLMELKRLMQPYIASAQVVSWTEEIDRLNDKLENMRFQVAVVGEFKRGKTSFINALLRKNILPADAAPATAAVSRITYGDTPAAYICWNNGKPAEEIGIGQLADYITKLTEDSAIQAQNIKEAVVRYPCRFCENNVDLIDTPGMNDDENMNDITIRQLADIDLVIVTLDPSMPVSSTEAHFIAHLVESSQICQIVFVVSKIDTVPVAQKGRLLELIENRLKKLVREALLETHNENDQVMEKYARIFNNPIIFPVSNVKALYAYEMGDRQALEDSGFLRLNDELPSLIMRAQHSAAIMTPLNSAMRLAGEFANLILKWRRVELDRAEIQRMKENFAETAYGLKIDRIKIWNEYVEKLGMTQNERSSTVASEILGCVRQSRSQTGAVIAKVSEIYQSLAAKLAEEEQNSYFQMWNECLCPDYVRLSQKLMDIAKPYSGLIRFMESDLDNLVCCALLSDFYTDTEAFYWESAPVPPANVPEEQAAYRINNAVGQSFTRYYRQRQSKMDGFLNLAIEEQEKKIMSLVQKFFTAAHLDFSTEKCIHMGQDTYDCLNRQLEQLVRRCGDTRDNYMAECQ